MKNFKELFMDIAENTRDFSHEMNRTTSKKSFKMNFRSSNNEKYLIKKQYRNTVVYVRINSTSKNWKLKCGRYVYFVHSHVIGWLELHT